jgi:hypothetical protein
MRRAAVQARFQTDAVALGCPPSGRESSVALLDIVALVAGLVVIAQGIVWIKDRWGGRR